MLHIVLYAVYHFSLGEVSHSGGVEDVQPEASRCVGERGRDVLRDRGRIEGERQQERGMKEKRWKNRERERETEK